MRVVIIGSGNVATVLGRRIKNAGHELLQVVGRNTAAAKKLADELGCSAAEFGEIDKTANIFLVAIADTAINELMLKLQTGDKIVVHTAGSVSKDSLRNISSNYGVLYPLQSLRKENKKVAFDIPLVVDGNNEYTLATVTAFAKTISHTVSIANDEERLKLHVAAVIASNFANHLYCLAEEYCKQEKLDFRMLLPLINETAERLDSHAACDMQTGPAARKDVVTLDKHLRVLTAHPKLRTVYLRMTDSIMNP